MPNLSACMQSCGALLAAKQCGVRHRNSARVSGVGTLIDKKLCAASSFKLLQTPGNSAS